MTSDDISKLSAAVTASMREYYDDLIKREVEIAVHAAKMDILTDIGENAIRQMIKEAVRSSVGVEVTIKK